MGNASFVRGVSGSVVTCAMIKVQAQRACPRGATWALLLESRREQSEGTRRKLMRNKTAKSLICG